MADRTRALPPVTVVIPTRDRVSRLRRTLDSVLAQDGVDTQIVVVDDASDEPVAPQLADLGDAVQVLRHDRSRGVAAARNAGIRAATTDWVALLDDDDLWAPDKLHRQLTAAELSGARWVYSDAIVVDPEGVIIRHDVGPDGDELMEILCSENLVPAGASNVLIHRAALDESGGFEESMSHVADWDLWLRLTAVATPAHVPAVSVAYVHHATNMHRVDIQAARRELHQLAATTRAVTGRPFRPAPAMEWIAEGQARSGRHWDAATTLVRTGVRWRAPRLVAKGIEQLGIGAHVLRPRTPKREPGPAWANPGRTP